MTRSLTNFMDWLLLLALLPLALCMGRLTVLRQLY
jgi:hypothetical protein